MACGNGALRLRLKTGSAWEGFIAPGGGRLSSFFVVIVMKNGERGCGGRGQSLMESDVLRRWHWPLAAGRRRADLRILPRCLDGVIVTVPRVLCPCALFELSANMCVGQVSFLNARDLTT